MTENFEMLRMLQDVEETIVSGPSNLTLQGPIYAMEAPIAIKCLGPDRDNWIPAYASDGANAVDLQAVFHGDFCRKNDVVTGDPGRQLLIEPGEAVLIPTGIAIDIRRRDVCGLIIPRSGNGHKYGMILGNGVGLIDSDYQGEVFVSIWNRSKDGFWLHEFDRIAQLIFTTTVVASFYPVDEFVHYSKRGENGFGSTGK